MLSYTDNMEEVLIMLGTKAPQGFHEYWKPTLWALRRRVDIVRIYGRINTYDITPTGKVALQLILMKRNVVGT